VGFLSDHCRRIEVDYQSGSKQPHSKGCRHLNLLIAFDFNSHRPLLPGHFAVGLFNFV